MKKILLLIGIGAVGALLVLCILGSLLGQDDTPAKSTPVPAPTQTTVPSTPTTVPATPPPTIDSRDVAYIEGWEGNITPLWNQVITTLDVIGEAAGREDVNKMCVWADSLVTVNGKLLLELEDLPSPEHPYLVNSHEHIEIGVSKTGAAGVAILNFCYKDGGVDELDVAVVLMEEGSERFVVATDWLNKYHEEIE